MKLWVDADASPREMKEIIYRAGRRLEIEVVLVANKALALPCGQPHVSSLLVPAGEDAADRLIAERAESGDLAVTADILLAEELVNRSIAVIDPRGEEYTSENVAHRRSVRDFMHELRGAGLATGGPPPYGAKDKQAFAATLDRVLTRLQRLSRS